MKKLKCMIPVIMFLMIFSLTFAKEKVETSKVKKRLVMWIMPNGNNSAEYMRDSLKKFEKEHSDIEVEVLVISWDSIMTKLTGAASGGEAAPDITQIGTTQVGSIAAMGAFIDLTGKYNEHEFVPAALKTTKLPNSKEVSVMPWFLDVRALYYKKDICKMAGVNPETDFKDWKKFKESLIKMKKIKIDRESVEPLVMPGKNDWNVLHNFAPWVWGAGGDFLSSDLKQSEINSEKSIQGIKYYSELLKEGLMSPVAIQKDSAQAENMFIIKRNKALSISGPWLIQNIEQIDKKKLENIGVALFPEGAKGRFTFLGGSSLGILKTSKNKKEALMLLEYLSKDDVNAEYASKISMLPAKIKALDNKLFDGDKYKVFKESLRYGRQYFCVPVWGISEGVFIKGLSQIWDNVSEIEGKYSIEKTKEILKNTAEDVNVIIKEN